MKEAHVLAAWYDLIHCPGLFRKDHLYAHYFGEMSKFLYFKYLIESKGLWTPLIRCICLRVGCRNPLVQRILEVVRSVEVYGWSKFSEYVGRILAPKVKRLFNDVFPVFKDFMARVFNIDVGNIKELYVIYGFNPGSGLYGSLLHYHRDYIIVSNFVNEYVSPKLALDLIYHELLHAILRLHSLDLPDEVEEELIDSLTPEGYLSIYLGLTDKLNIGKGKISEVVSEYFKDKLFSKGIPIQYYIKRKLKR